MVAGSSLPAFLTLILRSSHSCCGPACDSPASTTAAAAPMRCCADSTSASSGQAGPCAPLLSVSAALAHCAAASSCLASACEPPRFLHFVTVVLSKYHSRPPAMQTDAYKRLFSSKEKTADRAPEMHLAAP